MAEIVFLELEPAQGVRHPLRDGSTIGRVGTDVVLEDDEISRTHAVIRDLGGRAGIEDLRSRNGTFLNDRRVDGVAPLEHGDVVRFGKIVWRVDAVAPAAAGPRAEGPRGDVPAPELPSFAEGLPAASAPAGAAFNPSTGRSRRVSAARRLDATVFCFLVVFLTAVAVVAFLALRDIPT